MTDRATSSNKFPFAGLNLNYDSSTWDSALASQALIVPYVGSAEGYAKLRAVVGEGHRDAIEVAENQHSAVQNLNEEIELSSIIRNKIKQATVQSAAELERLAQIDTTTSEQIKAAEAVFGNNADKLEEIIRGQTIFCAQLEAAVNYGNATTVFLRCFQLLLKIAHHFDTIHSVYGSTYKTSIYAVSALTILMKSLDATWGRMRKARVAMEDAGRKFSAKSQPEFSLAVFEDWASQ